MTDEPTASSAIPPDDGVRQVALASPDDPELRNIAMAGDTYTILISGDETAGRFAVIDMLVPAGGGPPPHRHDFEEAFHILEGELEVTVRGDARIVGAGEIANVPAKALHAFRNVTDSQVRMLCIVSPAGLEEFFAEVGDPVPTRTSPAPDLSEDERAARRRRGAELAAEYGIEIPG